VSSRDSPAPDERDDETDVDPAQAERELAPGGTLRHRRSLYDRIRETLPNDIRNYAIAPVLEERVLAILDGRGITRTGGDPGVVADILAGLTKLMMTLNGEFVLRVLDFTSSVRIELEPKVPAAIKAEAHRRAVEDPDGVVKQEELRELIPQSVVAANAAARLLSAPAQDALREARRYGADVPDAFLRVARTVEQSGGSLRVSVPGRRRAVLTASRAENVIAQLAEPAAPLDPVRVSVIGHLSRTDADERRFRLVLEKGLIPDILDKRKRYLEGSYTARAGQQVQEGLWDKRVIARVDAYPVRDPLTGQRRFERFVFRNVELA
jgi:hypothetical protein